MSRARLHQWTAVVLAGAVAATVPAAAKAQDRVEARDVIESIRRHHPSILAATARIDASEGALLSADGAFDPLLDAQLGVVPLGYYAYARAGAQLSQYVGVAGATASLGYRVGRPTGRGGIPSYLGGVATLDGGELRAGLVVPLLRDFETDPRRAAIARARLGVRIAESDREVRILRLEIAGIDAFARWVAAGRKASIAEEMLTLAEERDAQIAARAAAGAIPTIERTENQRAILERRQGVVAAQRALARTALQLAIYLRDAEGRPRVPSERELPREATIDDDLSSTSDELIAHAIRARPELLRLRSAVRAAEVERQLRENQILPRLDVSAAIAADLGNGNETERATLGPATGEVGVTLTLPLGFRDASGRRDAARAELAATQAELALMEDQVRIEVLDARSATTAARDTLALAEQTATVAERLAIAERSRFEQGASTLLFVNIRESALAAARAAVADAEAEVVAAQAWLARASCVNRSPS